MSDSLETEQSHWVQTSPDTSFVPLEGDAVVDVAIIGGGLTGLHTALKVLEDTPGKSVVLLEAGRICTGASGCTVGKLATSHSEIFPQLTPESAQKYYQANLEGFKRALRLIELYKIDCDLQRVANYIFASSDEGIPLVREDYEAMMRAGVPVEWIESRDEGANELPLEFVAGLRHPNQAVYHPRKFALGLARTIQSLGGIIHEHTFVVNVEENEEGVTVQTKEGTVRTHQVVVATRLGLIRDEPFGEYLSPWRGHVGAWISPEHPAEAPLKNAYIRYQGPITSLRPNEAYLLASGIDEAAMPFEEEKHFQALDRSVRESFSKTPEPTAFWWGEDTVSDDMLPLIGPYRSGSKRIFTASGYSGWGMTKSSFAGIMLADLIAGRPSPYSKVFNPHRFQL